MKNEIHFSRYPLYNTPSPFTHTIGLDAYFFFQTNFLFIVIFFIHFSPVRSVISGPSINTCSLQLTKGKRKLNFDSTFFKIMIGKRLIQFLQLFRCRWWSRTKRWIFSINNNNKKKTASTARGFSLSSSLSSSRNLHPSIPFLFLYFYFLTEFVFSVCFLLPFQLYHYSLQLWLVSHCHSFSFN